MTKVEQAMAKEKKTTESKESSIDSIGKASENGSEPVKRKYTRRLKAEEPQLIFTEDQVALITSGLFVALTGLTKLPFKDADPDLKRGVDLSLVNVGNQFAGEAIKKWLPLLQLSVSVSMLTLDVYEKKRKAAKAKDKPDEQTQPES